MHNNAFFMRKWLDIWMRQQILEETFEDKFTQDSNRYSRNGESRQENLQLAQTRSPSITSRVFSPRTQGVACLIPTNGTEIWTFWHIFDMFYVFAELSLLWQFFPPTVIFKSASPPLNLYLVKFRVSTYIFFSISEAPPGIQRKSPTPLN